MARHVNRQRSPAAPGFDYRVATPQPQLATYEIELGALRLGERHGRVREVRAGVDEVGIEPQLIEVVAQVVVVDIAAGVAERIGRGQQRPDAGAPCRRRARHPRQRLDHRLGGAPDGEAAGGIRLAEPEVRVDGKTEQGPAVPHDQVADGRVAGRKRRGAIPQLQSDCYRRDKALHTLGQPAIDHAHAVHIPS